MQEGTVGGGCGITVPIEKIQVTTGLTQRKTHWFRDNRIYGTGTNQVKSKKRKKEKASVYGMFRYVIRNCRKNKMFSSDPNRDSMR